MRSPRRCAEPEFWVCTNILGSTVELRATHHLTGERFVSRAEDWETAVAELDRIVAAYGEGGARSRRSIRSYVSRQVGAFLRILIHRFSPSSP